MLLTLHLSEDSVEERGLAASEPTNDADELSSLHLKVHALQAYSRILLAHRILAVQVPIKLAILHDNRFFHPRISYLSDMRAIDLLSVEKSADASECQFELAEGSGVGHDCVEVDVDEDEVQSEDYG